MANIFINKINIENYKCFKEKASIDLSTPNGKRGSGLTIFIGENGKGKTSVLESIDYLTQSSYASENRLQINNFNQFDKPIEILAETNDFDCKMDFPYKGYFSCNGIKFKAESRNRKSPGKLLSSTFQINSEFILKSPNYFDQNGNDSGKPVPSLLKSFSNNSIDNEGLNIFYFDNNRTWQITNGNYKTTFERICDDLNWKFVKNLNNEDNSDPENVKTIKETITKKIDDSYFNSVIDISQKGVGQKLASDLCLFFGKDCYKDLKIEIVKLLSPFSSSFFALRGQESLQQISTRELGSGVEMIVAILLLKSISEQSKGSIIYLIDEPELHLHPMAQTKLIELLLEESKDKQIIISTHSPFIYKNCLSENVGLKLFKEENDKVVIEDARDNNWKFFPWSPSWGEINYRVFNTPSIELHNELYGYIQEKEQKYSENDIESFFTAKGLNVTKDWKRFEKGVVKAPYKVTLCTYIRNSIHHPENTNNPAYSLSELEESIKLMIKLL